MTALGDLDTEVYQGISEVEPPRMFGREGPPQMGLPLLASEAKSTPSPEFRPGCNDCKTSLGQVCAETVRKSIRGPRTPSPAAVIGGKQRGS